MVSLEVALVQKPLHDLPTSSTAPQIIYGLEIVCVRVGGSGLGHSVSPFFRILFSPETQLTLNAACLPWDRVSLLPQTHLVCGHQLSPSHCRSPCMCWLSLALSGLFGEQQP